MINWHECFICQKGTKEKLRCPGLSKSGAGYSSFSKILNEFVEIGDVPKQLKCKEILKLNTCETDLSKILLDNNAKFHNSCRLHFSKSRLERSRSKTFEKDDDSDKSTRGSNIPRSSNKPGSCFFCGKIEGDLHLVSTFQLDKNVRRCATELNDSVLLAKLSAGDMISQDAVYHKKCLVSLYNKVRPSKRDDGNSQRYESENIALAELCAYIEDTRLESDTPVFTLSDLVRLYVRRLGQLNDDCAAIKVNSSHLKDKIIQHIPDLHAYKHGRNTLLAFNEDIGEALRGLEDNFEDDAFVLTKCASIIRRDLLKQKSHFQGNFSPDCQTVALPQSLRCLVGMILGGANIETQSLAKDEQSALSIAQLILFNYRSGRKTGPLTNHSTDREPPLPVYLGMKIHAETRKKGLVDTLYSLGLSISYDRLLSISTALGNSAIDQYEEDGVVCPRKLRSGVFTTSAVDNIDHNPSSTTSQGSLHGTAISVFQHPRPGSEGKLREREFSQEKLVTNDRTVSKLPDTYTTVPPVQYRKHPPLPLDYLEGLNVVRVDNINCLEGEKSWLEHALRILESRDEGTSGHQTLSWSAYHASHSFTQQADVSVLLPLFQEQPQSVAMIRHAMDIVKHTTSFLNPGQVPVLTCDQPLYAIAKEIQWIWPDMYGESKFVIVLGGLHIEIAALKAIGKWLEDTGWTEVIVKGGVATEGTADSFLRAAHVTRTRHAHQVTAVSLYILLRRAYDLYACTSRNDVEQPLEFEPWIIKRESESPQFKFWYITLQFELLILLFVRSLREGNFQTYKDSLSQLIPWFFSLDKPNYARWLSVHIRDMISLDTLHPAMKREFEDGKFVVNKTGRGFSSIALDHAYEQNNKLVKGDGGAIGLTENSTQLLRWMVCGPEVARVIQEFHTLLDCSKGEAVKSHHEELPSVQRNFKSQVHGLCDAICESGNPFTDESSDLLVLGSRDILPSNVVDTVDKIYLEGEKQYNAFVEERFRKREKSLYDPIHQNKFALFNSPAPREVAKEKQNITSLKQNCSLFSQLYIACQVRDGDLDDFFRHENQDTPPSLSQYGSLRTGSKSDLIQCLESGLRVQEEPSNIDMLLIDGAVLVIMLLPRGAKTFLEYAETVFIPYIISQLSRVQRIDIIWDVYESNSLKHSTRV